MNPQPDYAEIRRALAWLTMQRDSAKHDADIAVIDGLMTILWSIQQVSVQYCNVTSADVFGEVV